MVANTFDVTDWNEVGDSDEALFKNPVVDDANPDNADNSVSGNVAVVPGLGTVNTSVPVCLTHGTYSKYRT